MNELENDVEQRRIRPLLAGLLTLLGWGVGLFYAGKTRVAIYMACLQMGLGIAFGGALLVLIYLKGHSSFLFYQVEFQSILGIVSWATTVLVAIIIVIYLSQKQKTAPRAGRIRLLGYVGIFLFPIVGAVMIAFIARCIFLQPFNIPTSNMQPTIKTGDYVIASKWSYGYSAASFAPFDSLLPSGRIFPKRPQRGDVVVFQNAIDSNRIYIDRVIGMPGDQIQMIRGVVHINGQATTKEFVDTKEGGCKTADAPVYRETLDNSVSYLVQECSGDAGPLDSTSVYQVPEGHYFMMGDNRDQSLDSRVISAVGYIPIDDIVGKIRIHH